MSVIVETGTVKSNSWDQNLQIWISHQCLGMTVSEKDVTKVNDFCENYCFRVLRSASCNDKSAEWL